MRPCLCMHASTSALTDAESVASVAKISHVPPCASMRAFVREAEDNERFPPKIRAPREESFSAIEAPMPHVSSSSFSFSWVVDEVEVEVEVGFGGAVWPRPMIRATLPVRSSILGHGSIGFILFVFCPL